MIPKYLIVKELGLLDKIWSVVLPSAISAWNVIVMRTFFIGFPEEIEQSGFIDGLNDIGVLYYLVLPTSGAILATMSLFHAVGYWNSFMEPFLYLSTQSKFPLQVILRSIVIQGSSLDNNFVSVDNVVLRVVEIRRNHCLRAALWLSYPFTQKYFMKGVMVDRIKVKRNFMVPIEPGSIFYSVQ